MTPLHRRVGRGLLLAAVVLFVAVVVHPFVLRGGVRGGKAEGGRYFVVAAGHRYSEVTEAQWRAQHFLECGAWLPVVLVWTGFAFRDGPGAPRSLTAFLGVVGAVGVACGVAMGWFVDGDPWTAPLAAWLVLWAACLLLARGQPPGTPDPAGG